MDAQFITMESFNNIKGLASDSGGNNTAQEALFNAVRSSNLSMALYGALPWRLWDRGAVGGVLRLTLATHEGSPDVFRRLIWGFRVENRSGTYIHGAAAEVGFLKNRTKGSLEGPVEFGIERISLDMELPIYRKSMEAGLFIQFHGEWPMYNKANNILDQSEGGAKEKIDPPIFQFRVGWTMNPTDVLLNPFGIFTNR